MKLSYKKTKDRISERHDGHVDQLRQLTQKLDNRIKDSWYGNNGLWGLFDSDYADNHLTKE